MSYSCGNSGRGVLIYSSIGVMPFSGLRFRVGFLDGARDLIAISFARIAALLS
jgi:hypothetical protein